MLSISHPYPSSTALPPPFLFYSILLYLSHSSFNTSTTFAPSFYPFLSFSSLLALPNQIPCNELYTCMYLHFLVQNCMYVLVCNSLLQVLALLHTSYVLILVLYFSVHLPTRNYLPSGEGDLVVRKESQTSSV